MRQKNINIRNINKNTIVGIGLLLAGLLIGMMFVFPVQASGSAPAIVKAQLINDKDIELYWDEEVTGAGWVESKNINGKLVMQEQNFSVTVDGKPSDIYYYCFEDYDNYEDKGIVYYNTKNEFYPNNPDSPKTTIRLKDPIADVKDLPEIKVTVKGSKIQNKSGQYAPEQTVAVTGYQPFYQKEITLDCGVKILGTANVKNEAMDTAEAMMKVLLANETVAKRMGESGCMLGIYGEGEIAYDIPEHRFEYDEAYLYVEGFGGTQLASIRDANVLRLKTGNYTTGYPDESILTHEFAHTIHSFGLSKEQQEEIHNLYTAAIHAGKWSNSYAGSNEYEYFATLSAIWFNAMDDTFDGNWDGVRGPINTRAELKVYDKAVYDFLSTIYVLDQYLPEPWQNGTVPDNYTYPGTETDPGENPDPGENTNPGETPDPGENPQPKTFKVKFVFHNGKKSITKTVKAGKRVSAPAKPKRKGYTFQGWYLGTKKYSFNSFVEKNIIINAKWKKVKVNKASIQSLKNQKGRKVVLTIKKLKGVKGYKVTYAKNAKFTKTVKTKYMKSTKLTIKNLKKGAYYFKVQAYCTDSTNRKVLGKASKVKKVTVKK